MLPHDPELCSPTNLICSRQFRTPKNPIHFFFPHKWIQTAVIDSFNKPIPLLLYFTYSLPSPSNSHLPNTRFVAPHRNSHNSLHHSFLSIFSSFYPNTQTDKHTHAHCMCTQRNLYLSLIWKCSEYPAHQTGTSPITSPSPLKSITDSAKKLFT